MFVSASYLQGLAQVPIKSKSVNRINESIKLSDTLLDNTTDSTATYSHYLIIQSRITSRLAFIKALDHELQALDNVINQKIASITNLDTELKEIKDEYAKMIYYAYKHRNAYNKMVYVLSAQSFNQSYRRLKYLQHYSDFRRKQAYALQSAKEKLKDELRELQKGRKDKRELLIEQQRQVINLAADRAEAKRMSVELSKRTGYLAELQSQRFNADKALETSIEELCAIPLRDVAKHTAKDASTNDADIAKRIEEIKIATQSFKELKGKLRWPTDKGLVSSYFGVQPHPFLKHVNLKNNGIDISTTQESRAKAVFDGVVRRIVAIPGGNQAIVVAHGDYFSVYSNLSVVYVSEGDAVTTGQMLGLIFTDKNEEFDTSLGFQIWYQTEHLNPMHWLAMK